LQEILDTYPAEEWLGDDWKTDTDGKNLIRRKNLTTLEVLQFLLGLYTG